MNCERFRDILVGDDSDERREAERHAEGCPVCAKLLDDDGRLAERIGDWIAATPAPPPSLERRIVSAIEHDTARTTRFVIRPVWFAAAAAVVLLVATFLIQRDLRPVDETAGIEETLSRIDRLGSEYARAIAELESRAGAVFSRVGDSDVSPEQAALLLS